MEFPHSLSRQRTMAGSGRLSLCIAWMPVYHVGPEAIRTCLLHDEELPIKKNVSWMGIGAAVFAAVAVVAIGCCVWGRFPSNPTPLKESA